ncbi:hypothetical protein IE077_000833 [Cardiosporidium cionae]|uniref:Thioredoxin domain-containing protein n=1 Tax=Cardiosporidium cionae TaxID=476202 RepID=A0ABQ7J6C9_9APIC|nr:hypothetical protein IE077_000833 [Cardiosporidium cionae]|eukprot:KAF8819560.1 hypothetical protein IE077_000833 [Cardiosporidium cionae]
MFCNMAAWILHFLVALPFWNLCKGKKSFPCNILAYMCCMLLLQLVIPGAFHTFEGNLATRFATSRIESLPDSLQHERGLDMPIQIVSAFAAAAPSSEEIKSDKGNELETIEFDVKDLEAHFDSWKTDIFILFYAPWGPLYRHMFMISNQVAKYFADRSIEDIRMARFNCQKNAEHRKMCNFLKITQFPTLAFIGFGKIRNFSKFSAARNRKADILDRIVYYYGDPFIWEQIRDWVRIFRWVSLLQRWNAKSKTIKRYSPFVHPL